MSFKAFDIVVVPFPFTDRTTSKRRPALVLSDFATFNHPLGHSVLAMITSAKRSNWPLDVNINDLDLAGLPSASIIRMKLFTLDDQLIIRKIGHLSIQDQSHAKKSLQSLFQLDIDKTDA